MDYTKENKKYRNSVFVDLFYEDITADQNDIALYNALHEGEEQLTNETEVIRFRIDDVLYMNFKNDISFGLKNKVIVFGEHQSTINYNMPLRSLMYIGRAYEQLVPVKDRYRKEMISLPNPEFYTFYNGEEKFPREETLRLSETYRIKGKENMLELLVKVINIKPEENHDLLDKCSILKEYSLFVECVEKHKNSGKEDAIKRAIEECIDKGILVDYLKRKGSQVNNMLVAEYDYELDIQVQREEAAEKAAKIATKKAECIKIISQTRKKIAKNISPEDCAEMLEEDLNRVKEIYQLIKDNPDKDDNGIYDMLSK